MSERQITIRMPKVKLAKWLKALRKGRYKQGTGVLYNVNERSFCCLGVLQHCLSNGMVEVDRLGYFDTVPSREWLREQRIEFCANRIWGVAVPDLPSLGTDAVSANDDEYKTFKEIADAIEACAEGI